MFNQDVTIEFKLLFTMNQAKSIAVYSDIVKLFDVGDTNI